MPDDDRALPGDLGNPARGAFEVAGYWTVESLAGASAAELLRLHGVGPRAVERLRVHLAERGLPPLT